MLDDFQAETLQRRNVHGRIRQEPNALDAEIRENLPAQADGTQNPSGSRLAALSGTQFLVQHDPAAVVVRSCRLAAAPPGSKTWNAAGSWSISKPREVLCR